MTWGCVAVAIRVGINGFGRIGRLVVKAGIKNSKLEFVAVNDLTDAKTLAHLYKYDSTFGMDHDDVAAKDGAIQIGSREIKVIAEKDPAKLPWKDLKVDVVIESTGRFTDAEKAKAHIAAGAKKVLISAPAKGEDITICMGINEKSYDKGKHHIVSNASCTTNCLAPLVKILNDNFKIQQGLMTTIHSYTNDQVILDFPHKDLRRARAAGQSMIPTTTGAAKAIGLVIPELKGKLNGIAIRVPTPNVSIVDLAVVVENLVSKEQVNEAFKKASQSPELSHYLVYCDQPLVSKDFNGNPASCIFDSSITGVQDKLVKVFGWYDNEWGYSNRVVELASILL